MLQTKVAGKLVTNFAISLKLIWPLKLTHNKIFIVSNIIKFLDNFQKLLFLKWPSIKPITFEKTQKSSELP